MPNPDPASRPILHAAWVPARGRGGALLLWGERREWGASTAPLDTTTVPRHPCAADEAAVRAAVAQWGGAPAVGVWLPAVPLFLPLTTTGSPQPSAALGGGPAVGGEPQPWLVGALALAGSRALPLLLRVPPGDGRLPWGAGLRFWAGAARLAAAILAGGRYLPTITSDADGDWAGWEPAWTSPSDNAARVALAAAMPGVAAAATPSVAPTALLDSFVRVAVAAGVRVWGGSPPLPPPPRAGATPAQQAAYEWLLALLGPDPLIAADPAALHALTRQVLAWRDGQQPALGTPSFRVCFRLEPPAGAATPWLLHFLLQATDDPSLLLPAAAVWGNSQPGGLLHGRPFPRPADRLRAGLRGAARLFAALDETLRHPAPLQAPLTTGLAYGFLREVAPALQAAGYGVLVPPWWGTRESRPAVRVQVAEVAPGDAAPAPPSGSGLLGAEAVVSFDWQVAVGDLMLDKAEFERLVALKTPLVQVQGRWVEFRPGEVEAALRFWTAQAAQPQRVGSVARLLLTADTAGLPLDPVPVAASPVVQAALAVLDGAAPAADLPPPPDLHATLRPYQVRGYSWLVGLRRLGLGACLADDMGLGKTIQTLALLLHAHDPLPTLLICPTSVVGNWQREVARFAPTLRVLIHQGPTRLSGPAFAAAARRHDLVLTSFSLLGRDEATLAGVAWAGLIVDEAQNLKNPDAGQTRAAKRLRADYRIALTGTPVENRLEDLWSIMDFLNPGLLGDRAAFRQTLAQPIEREGDPAATALLRARTGPLILRRLKTDRTIIQDLPEKWEYKTYCPLTTEQATLYEAVVRESMSQLAGKTGMARRGLVLGLLLRLKQIGDHPALFLGDSSALPGRSGKLARLTEMLDEALAVGDKALIFTQFATMGRLLTDHLAATFGEPPLYLYGGTPRADRDRMVAAFAVPGGPRLLVLSLKAGGVGLNLTAANHVFHFDRWWNPAVENQATDRAYRIGQRKTVQVHKLIAAGTLDERIDQLIESKRALADGVIGQGEAWLTELSDTELGALVALDRGDGVRGD